MLDLKFSSKADASDRLDEVMRKNAPKMEEVDEDEDSIPSDLGSIPQREKSSPGYANKKLLGRSNLG